MKVQKNHLQKIINNLDRAKVLVIGDIMLDHFIWGKVERISPEAPVPVVEVKSESLMPGGAANVAVNLGSLKVETAIIGIIGNDLNGIALKKMFKKNNISLKGLLSIEKRGTTKKTRIIAHNQQVVRVDREEKQQLTSKDETKVINKIKKILPEYDAVILEDYGKGMITQNVIDAVVSMSKNLDIYSAIDPKKGHDLSFKGINLTTPNLEEAGYLAKSHGLQTSNIVNQGEKLLNKLGVTDLLITRGEEGMVLFSSKNTPYAIPTKAMEVYDVSGAGDTVISVFCAAISSGAKPYEAAYLANVAAGIVVAKLGTATVTAKEITYNL